MDISKWLVVVSEDAPCGEDVEYDLAFLDLQESLKGKPEQQYGDTVIPEEAPDWKHIVTLCESLLSKSKDIRVMAALTQALAARDGFNGLSAGCRLLAATLESYWDDAFPLLHDDGELDPFFRINALGQLSSPDGVIKLVRQLKFVTSNLNNTTLTFKEAESILDETAEDENIYPGGRERLLIDLKVAYDTNQENIIVLREVIEALDKIDALFVEKLGPADKVGFDVILKPFKFVHSLISLPNGDWVGEDGDYSTDNNSVSPSGSVKGDSVEVNVDSWRKLNLRNRGDVSLVLEKVCAYFENYEPSHPAPLFIRRIQKLMNLNFYDIIKNVSPDSLSQIELLIGSKDDDEDENS